MKYKLIIVFVILMILTACSTNNGGNGSGTPDGLHISFMEFQPRNELRQNEFFDIGLNLENRAECGIKGELCIRDTLAESISGVQDECQTFELRKKEGGLVDSKKFYFTDNVYESAAGDLTSTIIARAQYSCSIQITPQLCVKPNLEEENVCKTKETIGASTLGLKPAPITVTSIEKTLIPQKDSTKLDVAIHVKKMPEGSPIHFNVNVEYEGYGPMECRNLERLDFRTNTESIINCEISLNVGDVEDNPLKISMNYVYETSASKGITLIKEEGDK